MNKTFGTAMGKPLRIIDNKLGREGKGGAKKRRMRQDIGTAIGKPLGAIDNKLSERG